MEPHATPRVRAAIAGLKPYVPGRSLESVQRELGDVTPTKMNQNENPLGPSLAAIEAAQRAIADMHIYPEGPAPALRERIAELWDVPVDWVLAGNGSDEVFRLLAEVYLEPDDVVVTPAPSFAGYALVADLMGAEVIRVPLQAETMDLQAMVETAIERQAAMMFLCRPNNPTGAVFSEDDLRLALARLPTRTLVVLDEAYAEFSESPFDARRLLLDFPNLIVTHTFSKIYGMAGMRLGYGLMRPDILAPLLRARDPFSVNGPAIAAGIAALDDHAHVETSRALVRAGRVMLYDGFDRLGLGYVPSEANFILFRTLRAATDVYEDLLRQGILVRPCGSFGLAHSVRVTIGTAEQNRSFLHALACVQESSSGL